MNPYMAYPFTERSSASIWQISSYLFFNRFYESRSFETVNRDARFFQLSENLFSINQDEVILVLRYLK